MLIEPNRTPYDLNFHLFGFPVRVHPLFWLGTVLLASPAFGRDLWYVLLWVVVVFVSVLVHELGHALAYRHYGTNAHIVLYAFGGLAVPWASVAGWKRRVVVALAGPAAGFVLYGLLYGSNELNPWIRPDTPVPVVVLFLMLLNVNLWWGVMNLLPVWPLDGGKVCDELCGRFARGNGRRLSLQISVAVAAAVSLYSVGCVVNDRQVGGLLDALPWWVPRGGWWTAVLFGVLAYQSYLLLLQTRWADGNWHADDRVPWER